MAKEPEAADTLVVWLQSCTKRTWVLEDQLMAAVIDRHTSVGRGQELQVGLTFCTCKCRPCRVAVSCIRALIRRQLVLYTYVPAVTSAADGTWSQLLEVRLGRAVQLQLFHALVDGQQRHGTGASAQQVRCIQYEAVSLPRMPCQQWLG